MFEVVRFEKTARFIFDAFAVGELIHRVLEVRQLALPLEMSFPAIVRVRRQRIAPSGDGVEPGGFLGTLFRWYMSLIYVPFKWLTGERFPADGLETCFNELDLELPPEFAAQHTQ